MDSAYDKLQEYNGPHLYIVAFQVTVWRSRFFSGMQWLLGRGMHRMRHVAYAGWLLTAVALTVSFLVTIARSFGVPATMLIIFTAYWSGSILKHPHPFAPCAVESGSLRAKVLWPSRTISAPSDSQFSSEKTCFSVSIVMLYFKYFILFSA